MFWYRRASQHYSYCSLYYCTLLVTTYRTVNDLYSSLKLFSWDKKKREKKEVNWIFQGTDDIYLLSKDVGILKRVVISRKDCKGTSKKTNRQIKKEIKDLANGLNRL